MPKPYGNMARKHTAELGKWLSVVERFLHKHETNMNTQHPHKSWTLPWTLATLVLGLGGKTKFTRASESAASTAPGPVSNPISEEQGRE